MPPLTLTYSPDALITPHYSLGIASTKAAPPGAAGPSARRCLPIQRETPGVPKGVCVYRH